MGFSIYAEAFDMCYRTRYALKGVNGEKVYFFFVYHFSYHSLGDLSTALEMTVIFSIVIQSVSEESPGKDTDLW